MKKLFLPFLVLLLPAWAGAQIAAITEEGRAVILFSNGTWRYMNDSVNISGSDLIRYSVPEGSTRQLTDRKTSCELRYNAGKWHLLPDSVYPQADFALEDKNGEKIAMLIAEGVQLPLATIREAALESFRKKGTEYRIAEEQRIMVNGTEGLLMKIDALVDGIPVTYLNAYFSASEGTFQLITYTAYNLFHRYRNDLIDLISGFVLPDP